MSNLWLHLLQSHDHWCCDKQTKGIEGQLIFWHCLNKITAQNGMSDPNFKELICDKVQNNVNTVHIVYGTGDLSIPMLIWLIYFIGQQTWISIQNNSLPKNFKTNIFDFVCNIRIQLLYPRQTKCTWKSKFDGTPLELHQNKQFVNSRVGSDFGIFSTVNGVDSWKRYGLCRFCAFFHFLL